VGARHGGLVDQVVVVELEGGIHGWKLLSLNFVEKKIQLVKVFCLLSLKLLLSLGCCRCYSESSRETNDCVRRRTLTLYESYRWPRWLVVRARAPAASGERARSLCEGGRKTSIV
jgi:hypothetical protein